MSKYCTKGILIDDLKSQYYIFNYEAAKKKNRSSLANSRQVKAEKDPAGLKKSRERPSRQIKTSQNKKQSSRT